MICVLDPDGKTVVEGQAKTNPFEIGRYLQKRLEGPLKLGMDRILALPWAAQARRLVEKRLEAQGRLTCTVRRSAHLSRRSFVDRKRTRLNSSPSCATRLPSSA